MGRSHLFLRQRATKYPSGLLLECWFKQFKVSNQQLNRMGHQNSSIKKIQQLTKSSITLRHNAGEKVFLSTHTRGEYVLITRLFTDTETEIERIINKRKLIKGQFIAQLEQWAKQNRNYCTNVEYLHLLFKRPAKTLLEEINNRRALDEWFDEGEVMMIGYCVLEGLKLLKEMTYQYDIHVDQSSLFISNDGVIVLSDTDQYTDRLSSKQCNSHRLKENKLKNRQQFSLSELGLVLDHLEKGSKTRYSEVLREFIEHLIKGQVESYNIALQCLYRMKKSSKNAQQKDAMLSLMTLCSKSNKTCQSKENNIIKPVPYTNNPAKQQRAPLSDITKLENLQNQDVRPMKRVKSTLQVNCSKKENAYLAYKSQFQAGVMETLAQDNRVFQQGVTLRLDQLSSIVERGLSKQLEQEQEQSTFLLQELDKPQKNVVIPQINTHGGMPLLQIPMIDLFSPSRPERLKQLVLNQKGIIYQQSGDELQSLASQRTFRHKNNLQ